ncbi:MAG: amidinotransferase [Bacteroidia bacterium]|nr:amidinotransferase [Bacteroidia bacterium]
MQSTSHVLLVRPASPAFNEETSATNAFQVSLDSLSKEEILRRVLGEFDEFVTLLRKKNVRVTVFQDQAPPEKPDAIFPNNWIAFTEKEVFLFPMLSPSRRLERNFDLIREIDPNQNLTVVSDLLEGEKAGKFLEGTGSVVMDHLQRQAYACLSERTNAELFRSFCHMRGYTPMLFEARDRNGLPIYHTNVVMGIGTRFALICTSCIPDPTEVLANLTKSGREIIEISLEQMEHFAGNLLELQSQDGDFLIAISKQGWESLSPGQQARLSAHAEVITPDLTTIEAIGGGSARCMLAEVFG